MKFGKRLLAEADRAPADYRQHFIDYKALKLALKTDVQSQDINGTIFFNSLVKELEKVGSFYADRERDLELFMAAVADAPIESSVAKLRSQLHALGKYVALNYIAVVKAIKKRNRHLKAVSEMQFQPLQAVSLLAHQHFYTSLKLASMVTHAEILHREHVPQGSAITAKALLEEYTCPVCLNLLRSPVVLSCAHLLCWGCLLAHCTAVRNQITAEAHDTTKALKGGTSTTTSEEAEERKCLTSSTTESVVAVTSGFTWVSESSDEESDSAVATFACPCCRKEQLMDLERLSVDPHLDAYILRLEQEVQSAAENSGIDNNNTTKQQASCQHHTTAAAVSVPMAILPPKVDTVELMEVDVLPTDKQHLLAEAASLVEASAFQNAQKSSPVVIEMKSMEVNEAVIEEPPLLPPQHPSNKGKLTVCLDLDGTLVTTFAPKRAPSLPSDAPAYIVGRGGKLNPMGVFVVERPGLQEFLHRIAAVAELVIFTAGLEDYAAPILDALEHRYGSFDYRLYRPATIHSEIYPCVKDLSRLGRPLERCVLVDDTPLAFFHQPENGIPVLAYRADPDDRILVEAVAPLIEALSSQTDVRRPLQSRFNMRSWFTQQGLNPPVTARHNAVALHRTPSAPSAFYRKPASVGSPYSPGRYNTGGSSSMRPAIPRPTTSGAAGKKQDLQLCKEAPSDLIVLMDFDKTVVDYDAGERLCEELCPELTSLLSQMESPANFIPATNSVLAEMQRRGVSRDKLIETLRRMGSEVPDASVKLLHWAKEQSIDLRVLSDCNSVFISHILAGAGVAGHVKQVITNPASFERTSTVFSTGAQQRLSIAPRHDYSSLGHHGCPLCPSNLCKGRELDALRSQNPQARIVYVGDGANDLCPALCLLPGDVVLARAGHALHCMLTERAAANEGVNDGDKAAPLAAEVMAWTSHQEMMEMVQHCVKCIKEEQH